MIQCFRFGLVAIMTKFWSHPNTFSLTATIMKCQILNHQYLCHTVPTTTWGLIFNFILILFITRVRISMILDCTHPYYCCTLSVQADSNSHLQFQNRDKLHQNSLPRYSYHLFLCPTNSPAHLYKRYWAVIGPKCNFFCSFLISLSKITKYPKGVYVFSK